MTAMRCPDTTTAPASAARAAGERGSISVWVMSLATSMMLLLGLAVDASGQIYTKQRAHTIAAEAARAGGQQLHGPPAVRGESATIDPAAALAAANAYLAAAPEITGTATITSGTTVVVTTQTSYPTKFLSIIGITTLPVTGHAEVEVNRVLEGSPR